jgi:hypothetical protein
LLLVFDELLAVFDELLFVFEEVLPVFDELLFVFDELLVDLLEFADVFELEFDFLLEFAVDLLEFELDLLEFVDLLEFEVFFGVGETVVLVVFFGVGVGFTIASEFFAFCTEVPANKANRVTIIPKTPRF